MSASCRRQAPNPRQNKSDLIESLLSETALNTREINPADPMAGVQLPLIGSGVSPLKRH